MVTGEISSPYLNQTRTEEDFVAALKAVINTDPGKQYRIVCDNLNTHMSESLVRYVADQIGFTESLGKKRNIEKQGNKSCFSVGPRAPHLLLLYTHPLFLDEPD